MISAYEKELDRQYCELLTARRDDPTRVREYALGNALGLSQGYPIGRLDGLAQGRTEARFGVAAKALSHGMSTEEITEITGLTAEELAGLR
jgi:hypothetical protein